MRILSNRRPLASHCLRASLAWALAACATPQPDPERDMPSTSSGAGAQPITVTVDRAAYAPGATVGLRIVNGSDGTFGYNPCTRTVEREGGGAWTAVPEPDRVCTMELRLLDGRATVSTTTDVPRSLAAGRYRLVLSFSREDASATANTGAVRVPSNPFRVE